MTGLKNGMASRSGLSPRPAWLLAARLEAVAEKRITGGRTKVPQRLKAALKLWQLAVRLEAVPFQSKVRSSKHRQKRSFSQPLELLRFPISSERECFRNLWKPRPTQKAEFFAQRPIQSRASVTSIAPRRLRRRRPDNRQRDSAVKVRTPPTPRRVFRRRCGGHSQN